jgi:hypothetical protein
MLAINNRKSIVTANKALLASHGADLFTAAYAKGEDIYYEASVAGAIPIIRPLRDSLAGDFVTRLMGIVNGTTNYILTKMHEDNREFADVLKRRRHWAMPRQIPLQILRDSMLPQRLRFYLDLPSTLASRSMTYIARVFHTSLWKMSRLQNQWTTSLSYLPLQSSHRPMKFRYVFTRS